LHLSATWFSLCNLCVLCASVVKFRSHPYENRYKLQVIEVVSKVGEIS